MVYTQVWHHLPMHHPCTQEMHQLNPSTLPLARGMVGNSHHHPQHTQALHSRMQVSHLKKQDTKHSPLATMHSFHLDSLVILDSLVTTQVINKVMFLL